MSRAGQVLYRVDEYTPIEDEYLQARKAMANNDKSRALEILQNILDDPGADQQLKDFAQSDINHLHGFNVKRFGQLMATAPTPV